MRIVVTGRNGQVARSLVELAAADDTLEIVALGRPELELAELASVAPAIVASRPDIVVSAAAYTAVDRAEDEPDLAHLVNARAAGEVARGAREAGAPVIQLSTDYVFSGAGDRPVTEAMPPSPINVYGASKLAGEQAVAAANPRHLILRTAWVYSPFGSNFVKTMLRLAADRDHIRVVDDQRGNPTSAFDIAAAILQIARAWRAGADAACGTYHFAGSGEASWCDFARAIFEVSRTMGGPAAEVVPIGSADYPTRAARPRDSRLDCTRFSRAFGHTAPPWPESLAPVMQRLLADAG